MISNNYTPLRQQGNGVTVAFSALWNMIASGYARVYFEDTTTGVQTPQLSGWSIVLAAGGAGWTVTFVTPPPSTVYVVIGRSVDLNQTNPYRTSRGWQGETVEGSFDKLTAITQDLAEQIERAIVFPLGDSASPVLPSAALRANTTFIFDSLGNASAGSVTGTTVSAPMIPVVNAATTAIAAALLGALTTAPGAVANSNLATMAANTIKANATAGVASPTDIALAASQILGRPAAGNIGALTLGAGMSLVGSALTATAGGTSVVAQVFTGSGTYTPTAGMDYCLAFLVGGGAGGRGTTNGTSGGNSSLGAILTANGGTGGQVAAGGLGGSAAGGNVNIVGQNGSEAFQGWCANSSGGSSLTSFIIPGIGGSTPLGMAGHPQGAAANATGYGAGGTTNVGTSITGNRGGGAGGYCMAVLSAAAIGASQAVTIGAAGPGGAGAGAGTAGICIIIEFI